MTSAVSATGAARSAVPRTTSAASSDAFASSPWRCRTSITALRTATPSTVIRPNAAPSDRSPPPATITTRPPTSAIGSVANTSDARRQDPNAAWSRR